MTTTALLGLLAQTSIHAGAGTQTGIIDLPIQREGHNGYPCVFGSSVKGALRAKAETLNNKDITSVYGVAPKETGEAGAIIVTDARLLLFPVRSLTSQFKWVTCPDVLRRYQEDCARLGVKVEFTLPTCDSDEQALVHNTETAGNLFLEEYLFATKKADLKCIICALVQLMQRENITADLEKQLVIVSNDSYTHLVNHATPVNAHIALDSATKTTTGGALWYEETLPPETLLYIGLSANKSRKQGCKMTATEVLNNVLELFPPEKPYLQIGGNETVGMGWCIVKQQGG